jgi:uncharacterized protein (DUF952 family)
MVPTLPFRLAQIVAKVGTRQPEGFLMTIVYKIVAADLWQAAEDSGAVTGAGADLNDGFIHLSTGAQAKRTAQLYFKGQGNLVLVAADGPKLGDALKYEPSRDGDLFPHLYGPLPLTAVLSVRPLPLGADGNHIFPDDLHCGVVTATTEIPADEAAAPRESACMLRPGRTTPRVARGKKAARSQ